MAWGFYKTYEESNPPYQYRKWVIDDRLKKWSYFCTELNISLSLVKDWQV